MISTVSSKHWSVLREPILVLWEPRKGPEFNSDRPTEIEPEIEMETVTESLCIDKKHWR